MSITTSCPGCKSLFRLPETLAGKKVRCQKCARMFVVPGAAMGAAEPEIPVAKAEPPELRKVEESPPEPQAPAAAVVEPKEEPPAARPQPPPLPRAPLPAERPVSVLGGIALLFLFLIAMVGTGVFAAIWIATHLSAPLPVASASPFDAIRDEKQKIDFGEPKWKDDRRDFGAWAIEKEFKKDRFIVAPQRILVALDGQGSFTDRRDITDRDPNREGLGQYKEYRVLFEEGKKYRIEMSLKDVPTALLLFDPDNRQIAEMKMKDAVLTHEAQRTGEYRIHAAAQERGGYTLRIITEP